MTIAFAECVSDNNNNDILYHVEWLDSEEAFPTLGSQTNNNSNTKNNASPTLQDWQILQKQEVYTDDQDDFLFFHDGKRLTVSEMEDKWEEIHYEKQYVDVAAENLNDLSSSITASIPPLKPLRHQPNKQQRKMKKEYTDEELRLLYWDQLDQLILEEEEMNGEAYDVYYTRKSQSPRSNRGNMHHLRRRLAFLSLNNHGLHYLNAQYSGNPSLRQFFNTIQSSTEASTENTSNKKEKDEKEKEEQRKQKAWGAPKINGRILHGLARLSVPSSSSSSSSQPKHDSKNTKTLSTDVDFTLIQ